MRRIAIRAFFAISAFDLASTAVEGCCRTKFKPVTKYTNQLIYILLYMDMYMAIRQLSYSLEIFGLLINPKRPGGLRQPIGQEIACHFSQDHAMVTKILGFI